MFFNSGSTSNDTKLYDVLNVNKKSSSDEIKKSYRKLALKHHPDRNINNKEEAETKFKEISYAYDILSNKDKKELYDKFGMEGLKNTGGSNVNPFDIFSNLFNMESQGMGGMGGSFFQSNFTSRNENLKAKDRVEKIAVSLEDIYNERVMNIRIKKKIICLKCKGTGGKYESSVKKCMKCEGKGQIIEVRTIGPGIITQSARKCYVCDGIGEIIKKDELCDECGGSKYSIIKKMVGINLNKNIKHGSKIVVEGDANEVLNASKGDLIFIIDEQEHPVFKRSNNNLEITKKILLSEALTELEIVIDHLDGRKLLIKTNEIITPDTMKKISNEGLNGGDLIIKFNIIFPKQLSDDRKTYIKKLLPVNNTIKHDYSNYEIKIMDDIYEYENINDEGNNNYSDNEEELGVNCAQQ